MHDKIGFQIAQQEEIRDTCTIKSFIKDLKEKQFLNLDDLKQLIQNLEDVKALFPRCCVKETNIKVRNGMRVLYEKLGIQYNDDFLRRPKVMISIDDGAGDIRMYKQEGSLLYSLIKNARKWSVFAMFQSLHSVVDQSKRVREQYTAYLIHIKQSKERLKMLFDELVLGNDYFTFKLFWEQYYIM